MARMLGVWTRINNPRRSSKDDLLLSVNGTILLNSRDVAKLVPGQLFRVRIRVMDDDFWSDDLVHTDNSFERGVRDDNPTPFGTTVIVPAAKLRNSEPGYEDWAEIYCRVAAEHRNTRGQVIIRTNWSNSQKQNVRI